MTIVDEPDFMWLFVKIQSKHFWFSPIGHNLTNRTSKEHIWRNIMMDLISCDFSPKICFKYLVGKYWNY